MYATRETMRNATTSLEKDKELNPLLEAVQNLGDRVSISTLFGTEERDRFSDCLYYGAVLSNKRAM